MHNRGIVLFVAIALAMGLWGCGGGDKAKPVGQDSTAVQPGTAAQPPQVAQTPPEKSKEPVKLDEGRKEPMTPPEPKYATFSIPPNTGLSITLDDTIQTNVNKVGDHFGGTIAAAVTAENKVVIPEGSKVDLVITQLVKGGTLKTSPEITFTIASVTLANGKTCKVAADSVYEKGRSHTAREVGMIGGGAAAGAIIGGLAGKGKGAAIGAAIGAAAGTGAAAATGRQNLVYAPGQTINFTTHKAITMTVPAK